MIILSQVLESVSLYTFLFSPKMLPINKYFSPLLWGGADYNELLRTFIRKEKSKRSTDKSLHCFWRNVKLSKTNWKDWQTNRRLQWYQDLMSFWSCRNFSSDLEFLILAQIDYIFWYLGSRTLPSFLTRDPSRLSFFRPFSSRSRRVSISGFLDYKLWAYVLSFKT